MISSYVKNEWFDIQFNKIELQVHVLPSDSNSKFNKHRDIEVRPTDCLTIKEMSRLLCYLKDEGFLD